MKKISIPRILLSHKQGYIRCNDKFDFIGSILLELGHDIPDKTKLPSDLKLEIPPFTRKVRRRTIDSEITLELMKLDHYPQERALQEANRILAEHYQLTITD